MAKELERAAVYRQQATKLLKASEGPMDEEQRKLLLELTATYLRMAEQIEEIYRLDVNPGASASGAS